MSDSEKKISRIETNMIGFLEKKNNRLIAIILSVVIGILFSVMFLESDSLGLNYLIFAVALLAVTGYIIHKDNNLDIKKFIFWSIAFLGFSSVMFRSESIPYTVMSFLITPIIFILLTIYSSKTETQNPFVKALLRFFGCIAFIDKIFIAIRSLVNKENKSKRNTINILIGVAISLLLLIVIVPLMFSADSMFQDFIVDIVNLSSISEIFWKVILTFVITVLFFGFIYLITVKKDTPNLNLNLGAKSSNNDVTIITVLSIIGIVYTLFAVVQFRYLFVGLTGSLPEGFSYTEYARNGYFEQVFLSIINFAIILVTVVLTNKSTGGMKKVINIMLSYFNVVNLYLMTSSCYKMYLYQDKYGFTTLRLLVYILLVYELIMLVTLEIKILKRDMKYFKCALYISVAFWAVVSFINVEAFSVEQNIKRFEETGEIDIPYAVHQSDVSSQLRYLYINHNDKLDSDDLSLIENYFNVNSEKIGMYKTIQQYDDIWDDMKLLEFNIAKLKKYKEGRRVLEYINRS